MSQIILSSQFAWKRWSVLDAPVQWGRWDPNESENELIRQFLPLSFVRNAAFQRTRQGMRYFDGSVGANQSPTEVGGASLVVFG